EHIAGFRIHSRAGSGIALINRITEKIVVEPLPKLLPALRIETSNPFPHVRAGAEIAHNVQLAVGNHRCGLARKVGHPEGLLDHDTIGQVFFERSAALLRSAPTQPAVGLGCISITRPDEAGYQQRSNPESNCPFHEFSNIQQAISDCNKYYLHVSSQLSTRNMAAKRCPTGSEPAIDSPEQIGR